MSHPKCPKCKQPKIILAQEMGIRMDSNKTVSRVPQDYPDPDRQFWLCNSCGAMFAVIESDNAKFIQIGHRL